jgi:hypothetical protein
LSFLQDRNKTENEMISSLEHQIKQTKQKIIREKKDRDAIKKVAVTSRKQLQVLESRSAQVKNDCRNAKHSMVRQVGQMYDQSRSQISFMMPDSHSKRVKSVQKSRFGQCRTNFDLSGVDL